MLPLPTPMRPFTVDARASILHVVIESGAFSDILSGLANASETILNQVKLASSQLHPAVASAAGWGRVTTESGGPRVTNFYYQGQRVAPSPKIRELMDQIADELERERQHPRD